MKHPHNNVITMLSSSTWRTWIEMHRYHTRDKYEEVVLHMEDVD